MLLLAALLTIPARALDVELVNGDDSLVVSSQGPVEVAGTWALSWTDPHDTFAGSGKPATGLITEDGDLILQVVDEEGVACGALVGWCVDGECQALWTRSCSDGEDIVLTRLVSDDGYQSFTVSTSARASGLQGYRIQSFAEGELPGWMDADQHMTIEVDAATLVPFR